MSVISVQSHVVFGNVGNKCAIFPLQLVGLQVDSINTVQFSNHTGYPVVKGDKLTDLQLDSLIKGLRENQLLDYRYYLSGYIGNEAVLKKLAGLIESAKAKDSSVIYVLDPVMGDNDYLYVPKEVLPVYRDVMMPLADIATPNAFELKLLTGLEIKDMKDTCQAIDQLHEKGTPIVVVTSIEFSSASHVNHNTNTNQNTTQNNNISTFSNYKLCLIGSVRGSKFKISFPKLEYNFTGTGDLFAAILLSNIHTSQLHPKELTVDKFKTICELTLASMQIVLKETILYVQNTTNGRGEHFEQLPRMLKMKLRELRIVQSRKSWESPAIEYFGELI